jgi:hypothetical protein
MSAGWNAFISTGAADEISAEASYKTEGSNKYGAMTINSIGDPTMWWHAQLRQNGVYLNGGGAYILTFKVRAAAARTIRVQIQGGGLTSKPTALNELPVQVGTTWETKTINFIAPSNADNAELQFGLGPDSFLPNDLVGFARSFAEVHLDDVKLELGEPLPNQAPTISGGDLLGKKGEAVLVKGGLTVRDDYDKNLRLLDVTAIDITNGTKLNAENPAAGFYTFIYTLKDSEGLVGSHQRRIIITDPNQLFNNTNFSQYDSNGMPMGWTKWSEDNRGGQNFSAGVMPHLLPESLLGNIQNGDFSSPETFTSGGGWSTFISSEFDAMNATVTQAAGEAVFTTTSVGADTQFWHGQLIHGGNIRLPQGSFKLEFRAKAAAARTIRVALEGDGINGTARAINELPVVLGTEYETYSIEFTTVKHVFNSSLRFFFGPDSFLPTEPVDLTAYARKTDTVYLDDITFRYADANSPVATMIPTMAVNLWRIGSGGMPWENQLKYSLPFLAGDYKLNFKARADIARPVLLIAEGDGGVDQPRFGAVNRLTPEAQAFSYDVTYVADATNLSYSFQFFMGSYENYGDFKTWWPNIDGVGDTLSAEDNILTTIYLFDFSLVKVA